MTREKSENSRTPSRWNSTATARAAKNLRTLKRLSLPELLGHGLVVEQVDLVQRAEIDRRSELDAMEQLPPLADVGDRADRDAARIDTVDAGGQHHVAGADVGLARHEVELQGPRAAGGGPHEAPAAGARRERAPPPRVWSACRRPRSSSRRPEPRPLPRAIPCRRVRTIIAPTLAARSVTS